MKVLTLDTNHPILLEKLKQNGYSITEDYTSSREKVLNKIGDFEGIIIRSRFPLDKTFLEKATQLKWIGRVGAGLENIDLDYTSQKGIRVFNAPEGNRDALGEHALGMLLSIMNRFKITDNEVRNGIWKREENRGEEIKGKTVALIGYGNMGKAFSQRLKGFDCRVIFYDILENLGDENATQVDMKTIFAEADILSLHIPLTDLTKNLVNQKYIEQFKKPFYLINTARGKNVVTDDLVAALKSGKIKATGLDVLEYEKSSFESLNFNDLPTGMQYLLQAENVLLTPHIGGWTHESKRKLAQVIADKIIAEFG